ncbi:phycobiliprotein lyase [Almyronema epifaneia]|uniref:Chromophore lyase CpcS/CpeS n=1 Tax=Almyronema epifaneia S1 TaxID=2991925 RepID=A0ABW6IE64_9CYAN
MEAMDFFRLSEGRWRSQRTTHHLPFRRAELGELEIRASALEAGDPRLAEICQLHQIDPALAIGGGSIQWQGSMAWDQDKAGHQGATIFALVPDEDNPKQGKLLRDIGYAEKAPVVGYFQVDNQGGLVLITDYEATSSVERFWFPNPNLRIRTSTVQRFGGFSTASFCAETRLSDDAVESAHVEPQPANATPQLHSIWGW